MSVVSATALGFVAEASGGEAGESANERARLRLSAMPFAGQTVRPEY